MSRTIVCSKVHDAFPNAAVLGGHSTFSATAAAAAVTVSLEAAAAAAVVWLRECAALSMEVISSQAGRSQSSTTEENAGGVDRSLEAFGGSVVPVMFFDVRVHSLSAVRDAGGIEFSTLWYISSPWSVCRVGPDEVLE
jgi:hypothetical protein